MNLQSRVVAGIAYLMAAIVLYLASPLVVYATASLFHVDRGIDNAFADFLDAFYEPAQRLTEEWGFYDRFIVWTLKITGQT